MLSEEKLYRLFLAGLRLRGHQFVDTREDDHHRRFAAAVEVLNQAHAHSELCAVRMPEGILPSPFTRRFPGLDQALLNAQETGTSGARNPYYLGADLAVSEDRARRVLSTLSPEERELVDRMVAAFDAGMVATDETKLAPA